MCIEIAGRAIGPGRPLFVIAELGLNHGGSLEAALQLVDAAARAKASAIKLQTVEADRLVAESCLAPAHVEAASLRDFFRRFELDEEAHRAVAARARRHGLAVLSTPFNEEAVDMLASVGCDALKIASGDITHTRLIERAAATGLPLIISTGMSDLEEVAEAVGVARAAGARALALLHCVSAYPVPAGSENLGAIAQLAREFGVPVGLSDHGNEPLAAPLAVALGACIYERHLVRAAGDGSIDAAVSATPEELAEVVDMAARARAALGDGRKVCLASERMNRVPSRRSLYATRDLKAGDIVSESSFEALRPAVGLDARRWRDLAGTRLARDLAAGSVFLESDIEVCDEPRTVVDVA